MATGIPKTKWQANVADTVQPLQTGLCLSYEHKSEAREILGTPPASLIPLWNSGQKNDCRLYCGDNLPILAALLRQEDLAGKIKLIYIDPPFATNGVFQSRSQADAYQDLLTGAPYIEFIRKRLILLRELLAEDGSIYVHLDDNMAQYIKVIMDEVFGVQNYRNWITRRKCSHKNYTKKNYGNISDYILFYTKSNNYVWNRSVEEWTQERANKEYPCIEAGTGRRYKKVPVHAPGTRNGETGKVWHGMMPPPGKHWQYTPATLDDMDTRGEIYWSPTGNPRRIIYLEQSEGVAVQDIWHEFRDTRNQNVFVTGYPTEKNPELLERIICASSNAGDVVLDCFCGSGTTLAAAARLGRKWIGMDNSIEAIATTLKRLSHGTERMGDYVSRKQEHDLPAADTNLDLFGEDTLPPSGRPVHIPVEFDLYAEISQAATVQDVVRRWQDSCL